MSSCRRRPESKSLHYSPARQLNQIDLHILYLLDKPAMINSLIFFLEMIKEIL